MTVLFWTVLLLVLLQLALTFAPRNFWAALDQRSSKTAAFLWGFSHFLSPPLKSDDSKPWLE